MQSIKRALKRAVASLDDIPSALNEAYPSDQTTLHKKRRGNATSDSVSQPTNNADMYSQMFEAVLAKVNSDPTVNVSLSPGPSAKLESTECTSVCCQHEQLIINMLLCQNQLIDSINNKIDAVMSFLQVRNNSLLLCTTSPKLYQHRQLLLICILLINRSSVFSSQ